MLAQLLEDKRKSTDKASILVAPTSGKPFLLDVRAMDHSLGDLLAQKNDEGYEGGNLTSRVP